MDIIQEYIKLGCPVTNCHNYLYDIQKWLRDEKKLHITIFSSSQESWMYRITEPHQKLEEGIYEEDFESFEEALQGAIEDCWTFLK